MKTYILSKLASIQAHDAQRDELAEVQKIICNKPWRVFNDGDDVETYLFKKDGSLKIIFGGSVTDAKWTFEPALKCIEVNAGDKQRYMLQVAFFNEKLLTMRLYQANEYCFMIEQDKYEDCGFKSLNDVTTYIKKCEALAAARAAKAIADAKRREAEEQEQRLRELNQLNITECKVYGEDEVHISWEGTGIDHVEVQNKHVTSGQVVSPLSTKNCCCAEFYGKDGTMQGIVMPVGMVDGKYYYTASDYANAKCKTDNEYQKYKKKEKLNERIVWGLFLGPFIIIIILGCFWEGHPKAQVMPQLLACFGIQIICGIIAIIWMNIYPKKWGEKQFLVHDKYEQEWKNNVSVVDRFLQS